MKHALYGHKRRQQNNKEYQTKNKHMNKDGKKEGEKNK